MFLQGCLCRNTYGFIHDAFMISPVNCILANETFVTNRSSVITTTTWQIQIMSGDMSGQDEPVVLDKKQNKLNLLEIYFSGKHVWHGCWIMQSMQLSIHNKNLSCKFEYGIQTSQTHLMVQVVGSPQCHLALTALWMQRMAALWPSTTTQGKQINNLDQQKGQSKQNLNDGFELYTRKKRNLRSYIRALCYPTITTQSSQASICKFGSCIGLQR